jgi:hypothetical protein
MAFAARFLMAANIVRSWFAMLSRDDRNSKTSDAACGICSAANTQSQNNAIPALIGACFVKFLMAGKIREGFLAADAAIIWLCTLAPAMVVRQLFGVRNDPREICRFKTTSCRK